MIKQSIEQWREGGVCWSVPVSGIGPDHEYVCQDCVMIILDASAAMRSGGRTAGRV